MALFRVTAVVLVLSIAASASTPTTHSKGKPTSPPVVTPEQRFQNQVDAANVALDAFLRLDCEDPANLAAAQDLLMKMKLLRSAYQDLPADEDQLAQLKHAESFVGFTEVSTAYINMKRQACTEKPAPKATPGGNNG